MNNPMEKQRCHKCGAQVFRPSVAYVMACKVCEFRGLEEAKAERQRMKAMSAQLSPPTKENLPLFNALSWLQEQLAN